MILQFTLEMNYFVSLKISAHFFQEDEVFKKFV